MMAVLEGGKGELAERSVSPPHEKTSSSLLALVQMVLVASSGVCFSERWEQQA